MKKLFTLLFAVVTVAAFAVPTAQKAKKLQPQKLEAKIEMQAQKGDLYTGKAGMMKDFTSGVDTMYMTPTGTFYSAFFPYNGSFLYSYNMALIPTNVETTWTNISIGIASDTYDWVYYNPAIDEEYLTQVEGQKDLVATFPNYPGGWIAPRLYANAYDENASYYAFGGAVQYGGKFEQDVLGDGTTLTNMYQFSPRTDYFEYFRTSFGAGYGEDANSFYADLPDAYVVEGSTSGKIVNFIQIFNYPGRPYTFSRIQFYANCSVDAGKTLTAKVCKINDGIIDLDNPIATASYEFPAQVMDETTAIDFYFEKEDPELGLTEEDWLLIDTPIAVVIEGVNDVENIKPLMQAITKVADLAHDEFYDNGQGGYGMWEFYDASGNIVDSKIYPCHLGYYWGSDDDSSLPNNLLLSINAQMAFIETVADNATEYTIPATGGEYTLELKASEPYDAWNVEEVPEWMTVEATDSLDTQDNSYAGYTTLAITVQPNNNGEVVYTLPGTSFTIKVGEGGSTVVPGDVNGDGEVTAADITMLYNVLLNDDYTGVVNGDQNGDGSITAGDVTAVYNILLGGSK